MTKQRFAAPAALTALAAGTIVQRARKQRKERAHARGIRRLARRPHR